MSEPVISAILVLVLVGLIAALVLRHNAVQDFEQKKRARHWADYVAQTVLAKSHLYKSHGFFIDPTLSQHALEALQKKLPQAAVAKQDHSIRVKHGQLNWVIPICTSEEYAELFTKDHNELYI